MYIDASGKTEERLREPKTMKVKVPTHLHMRMHGVKILHGVDLSEMVTEAMQRYLKEEYDVDGIAIVNEDEEVAIGQGAQELLTEPST